MMESRPEISFISAAIAALLRDGSYATLLGNQLLYYISIKIFEAVKETLRKNDYDLLYFSGEAYKSPFDFLYQSNILYNMITPQIVDGLITVSNLLLSFVFPDEFHKRCLQFHPLPVVSLGINLEGIPIWSKPWDTP